MVERLAVNQFVGGSIPPGIATRPAGLVTRSVSYADTARGRTWGRDLMRGRAAVARRLHVPEDEGAIPSPATYGGYSLRVKQPVVAQLIRVRVPISTPEA